MDKAIQGPVGGEQVWSAVLARQEASGLSVRAFCRREGLKEWSMYDWRRRLRARRAEEASTGQASTPPGPQQQQRSRSSVGAAFIDIGALGSSSGRWEVRLDLGGGMVLTLARG